MFGFPAESHIDATRQGQIEKLPHLWHPRVLHDPNVDHNPAFTVNSPSRICALHFDK